ncbi:hypothetical protein [Cellulomonas sp.]|uniref:hypothetical protein n=1 Tax=Cellulomonas sp. TaxID=40001 RepID=UPI003BA9EDF8
MQRLADDLAEWRHALTVVEAAEVIGSTPRTTARLVTEGRLDVVTTGGHGRIVARSADAHRDADSARRRAALART